MFDDGAEPTFCIWLCGTFRVQRRVGTSFTVVQTAEWGGSSHPRLLLKALVCCPGRQARREALLDMLWPEADPEQAVQHLNTATTKLRSVLRPTKEHASLLLTENDATIYRLPGQEQLWVDADEALAALKEVERLGRTSLAALSLLEQAIHYFNQGTFLDGEEGLWASGKRATIERARYRARLWLAEAYEQQGMPGQAEMVISLLLEEDPMDEDALNRLLHLLHRQGMTQKALRLYEQARRVFAEEGLELTEATEQLAAQLSEEHHRWTIAPRHTASLAQDFSGTASQDRPALATSILSDSLLEYWPASKDTTNRALTHTLANFALPPLVTVDSAQSLCLDEANPEVLRHFAAVTTVCRSLSEGNELQAAERTLWAYLPRVETIAKLSFEAQRIAAEITSQGYLLAASLAGHRNDLQARHHYSEQALLYGKLAEDRTLQIVALRQLAITFDYLGYPDKVLQIYQQAVPYLDQVSPLLRACIYADISGSYTQLRRQQEAKRYVDMAYECFPTTLDPEPDYLSTICRYATLVLCEGLCHLAFAQPSEAEKVFAKIDGLQPKVALPERIRIDVLNCQGETFLALGKMDQACYYLERAVQAALAIGSKRRYQEASALFHQMCNIWHNERPVQRLAWFFER